MNPEIPKPSIENKEQETLELTKRHNKWFERGMLTAGVASGVTLMEAIIMAKIGMPPEIAIPAFTASGIGALGLLREVFGEK